MTETYQTDILIIGAGVVGCAVARHLAKAKSVTVVEAGPRVGGGVTSRNSGVIHAGIYYPPNSLKAKTCLRGNSLLYQWAETRGVRYKKMGKLIIARGPDQIVQLDKIFENAMASGAQGLCRVGRREIQALEPEITADEAIYSRETGIVDAFELTQSFQKSAEQDNTMFLMNTTVEGIELSENGDQSVKTSRGPLQCEIIINCAGLYTDEIAGLAGINKYKIYPCRGDYFKLKTKTQFKHLIYPVKDPKDAGLGVHLTMDLSGAYRVGPDVQYVDRKDDFSSAEDKLEKFKSATARLLENGMNFDLAYDTCGIRPKLRSPAETQEKDFIVSRDHPGMINLVGIESPGLTSAMALAEEVSNLI